MYTNKFKKGISILVAFALMLSMSVVSPYFGDRVYADEDVDTVEEMVVEVSTWDEFKKAFKYSEFEGEHYTIRLMEDLSIDAADKKPRSTTMVEVYVKGSHITFDFNGHTLKCNDNVPAVESDYELSDFITIYVVAEDGGKGSTLRFMDSSTEGDGGVYMYSKRAYDTEISALNVIATDYYYLNFAYGREKVYSLLLDNQVIFDGGNYKLECETEKSGKGTVSRDNLYRSCVVISGFNKAVVNDGSFMAIGSGNDSCTRELTAFGTYTDPRYERSLLKKDNITINGGWFYSNGYSLHSFGNRGDDGYAMVNEYMTLNGGLFFGPVSFVGGFYKNDGGNPKYNSEPASTIIKNKACGVDRNGKNFESTDNLTLADLHKVRSCYVFGPELLKFHTTPAIGDKEGTLKRSTLQTETFTIDYKVPAYWTRDDVVANPYFIVTPTGGQSKAYEGTTLDVNYTEYPKGVTITACLSFDPMSSVEGQAQVFSNTYTVEVYEEQRAAEIKSQPVSVRCEPGETATLSVTADYGKSYEWYIKFGDKYEKISAILSVFGQLNGVEMTDYQTPNLKISLNGIDKAYVYCEVTGTDGTKVKSDYVTITFGGSPKVDYFTGGKYYEGEIAKFYLKTKYVEDREDVTFIVYDKKASSSAQKFYTLEEFTAATGIKATAKVSVKSQFATVTFENVPSSASAKYALGYQLSNTLGKTDNMNPETMLYFEMMPVYPKIITDTENMSCYVGGTLEYAVAVDEATSMEWRFETIEDETVVAYSIDEMRAKFPKVEFKVEQQGNELLLTIENAETSLNQFGVYAHIVGKGASISSNIANLEVRELEGFHLTGRLQGLEAYDGTIEILLTDKDAGSAVYKGEIDKSGNYAVTGVSGGEYVLTIKAEGFAPYECDVTFVNQDVVLNVVMEVDTHKCTLSLVNKKAATFTSAGKQAYYQCDCGKCYEDAAGTRVIPKLNSWGTIAAIDEVKLSYTKKLYTGSAIAAPTLTIKDSNGNTISSANYTVSGLTKKTSVGRYKVAVTFKGDYEGTTTLYFTIVPKAPSSATAKLTSYYGQTAGYDDVKFSWSKVTGASGYNVYYKKSTSSSYTYLTRTTNTYIRKKNLSDGAKYIFKVVPYYKSGDTRYTSLSYKTASVYTLKKLATPTVSKSGTKVKVTWKNISGETGYQISQSTSSTGTKIVSTYATTSGKYKTISATRGKTYYYKVRAYKTVDGKKIYGPWSAPVKFKRN